MLKVAHEAAEAYHKTSMVAMVLSVENANAVTAAAWDAYQKAKKPSNA